MKLIEILQTKNYKTDKHTKHTYIQDFYEDYFVKYQQSKLNLLEIGVWNGESMKLWADYFVNAKNIIGIDIFERTSIEQVQNNLRDYNVSLYKMNSVQSNDDIFNQFASLYPDKFDIIIDDGCHQLISQVETFKRFSKLMNKNGIYIIEDIMDRKKDEKTISDYIPEITIISNHKDISGIIYF